MGLAIKGFLFWSSFHKDVPQETKQRNTWLHTSGIKSVCPSPLQFKDKSCISALNVEYIQSNFNSSNTYGTMKISLRQGLFEAVRVDFSTRSGGKIGISFRFSLT